MRTLKVLISLLLIALLPTLALAFDATVYRPDRSRTPGIVATEDPGVVCRDSYTKTVRDVPARAAKQVFALYGIDYSQRGKYEVDHLISLELGGSNDVKNLWPQMYCPKSAAGETCFGAREKDVVETSLHRRICRGEISMQSAQFIIVNDWFAEYQRIKGLVP